MMKQTPINLYAVPDDLLQQAIALEVRARGDDGWQRVPLAKADSMSEQPHAHGGAEAWAVLAFVGTIECRVTMAQTVVHAMIRPSLREPVAVQTEGCALRFTLEKPRYVVVEINHVDGLGQPTTLPRYTLYLLTEAPDEATPANDDVGVCRLEAGHHEPTVFEDGRYHTYWLRPGVHTVAGELLRLHSRCRLHLEGGAYLRAYVHADGAEDLTIDGHGVIDGTGVNCRSKEWRDDGDAAFVLIRHGRKVRWNGPTIYNAPFWNWVLHGGSDIGVRRYKCIGWRMNNDGLQPRNCEDMTVEQCFLKCADDCVAIKSRRSAAMRFGRLRFRELVLWNDHPGNVVEIGHTSQADYLSDVRFENIEVVHAESPKDDRFIISIFLVDHCTVADVVYDGFYVEGFLTMRDVGLQIASSRYSTDDQRGRIVRVRVKNYHRDSAIAPIVLRGVDETHNIDDVTIGPMYRVTAGQSAGESKRWVMPKTEAVHAVNVRVVGEL